MMYTNLSCIVKGLIAILFGFLAIFLPGPLQTTFIGLFWVFIVIGIAIFLLLATTSRSDESLFWFGLAAALVITCALSLFAQLVITLVFMLIIAGIAFYSGFSDINYALRFPKTKYYMIIGMFLISVLLLGVLFRTLPVTELDKVVLRILGTFALIFGIFSIAIGLHEPADPAAPAIAPGPIQKKFFTCSCKPPREK
ncbi:MAG: hypothetical protein LUP97_06130 [Methanoregula sp.]|jgi:hypothetical protein|nr:hypothetical protein [Methanoregula sp.]